MKKGFRGTKTLTLQKMVSARQKKREKFLKIQKLTSHIQAPLKELLKPHILFLMEKEFLGSTIRYRVIVRGDDVFADVSHQQGRRLIENGTSVNLGIDQKQVMVVND